MSNMSRRQYRLSSMMMIDRRQIGKSRKQETEDDLNMRNETGLEMRDR